MQSRSRELSTQQVECIVIGYNEEPFQQYERNIRKYGVNSVAYRDLGLSWIDIDANPTTYLDVMNYAIATSNNRALQTQLGNLKSGDIPNLAAVYLTNYLRMRGVEAQFINLFQSEKEALAAYLATNLTCVAITTTFYVLNSPLYEMVDFIRARNKTVKIVVGGPLIANHHRNSSIDEFAVALKDIGADVYVINSQGEETLTEIVKSLRAGKDLSHLNNVAFFERGILKMSELRTENNSMNDNEISWTRLSKSDLGPTLQTRTARSCAFSCSFCNYPTRAGKLTLASIETIDREISSMIALGNVKNVVFIDDTFNVPLKRFKEICRKIISRGYLFNWFSYFRCSNSDAEAIELMQQSGCKGVFLGIESGSPEILQKMNKAANIEDYAKGISLLHEHGILTFASFITGFPGETDRTVQETHDFILETCPTYFRSQVWYCEPGTPIMNQRERYAIKGSGFAWKHATMDSVQAIEHVEQLLCAISESTWLPQWSFDFWVIPYLLGKGITQSQLLSFLKTAHQMLILKIKCRLNLALEAPRKALLRQLVTEVNTWS